MKKELLSHLISIRRQLHQFPELGYQEFRTSKLVSEELKSLGIPHRTGVAKTGVVADLKMGEGPTVVLRADMDALPLMEETGLPFSSQVDRVMHACGHDVHTTMLLGAAHLLKDMTLPGTVRLIFQPSEEGTNQDSEKKSGGQRIAESAELENVKAAVALHVHPLLEVGKISVGPEQAMAGNTCFKISVHGKYGHAAFPHLGIDAIVVATQVVQSVQSIVTRYTSPTQPVVISFTTIHGGVAPNVTAEVVDLEGTIRAIDLATFEQVIERLKTMLKGIEMAYSARISIEFDLLYPSLLNDLSVHAGLNASLGEVFGATNVLPMEAVLGSEDFAFYSRKIPSMFYFLGARAAVDSPYFLHHPKMVVNEDCIPLGARFLAAAAKDLLAFGGPK